MNCNNEEIQIENDFLEERNNLNDDIDFLYKEIEKKQDRITEIDHLRTYGDF